jgi:hypothetical protein
VFVLTIVYYHIFFFKGVEVDDFSLDKEEGLPKRSKFGGIGGKNRATATDQQANTEEDSPAVSGKKKGFV